MIEKLMLNSCDGLVNQPQREKKEKRVRVCLYVETRA